LPASGPPVGLTKAKCRRPATKRPQHCRPPQPPAGRLTVKVPIDDFAAVVIVVHRQDGAVGDEVVDFIRERGFAGARGPRQAHLHAGRCGSEEPTRSHARRLPGRAGARAYPHTSCSWQKRPAAIPPPGCAQAHARTRMVSLLCCVSSWMALMKTCNTRRGGCIKGGTDAVIPAGKSILVASHRSLCRS
jgi:hypothetical protein